MWDVFIAPCVAVLVTLVLGKLYYKHEITVVESLLSIVLATVASIGIYYALVLTSMQQTEIWNGEVTGKYRMAVPCEHSYEVCSGSGDNKTCTTHYRHHEDYDWVVETTVGDLTIQRLDEQGVKTPPRWKRVIIGEPAATEHWYTDYVKGNADSIFHVDPNVYQHWESDLVSYPRVLDYYRMQRVITTYTSDQVFEQQVNAYLNEELKSMGASHQLNIVVIFTKFSSSYANALKYYWEGGRKNDVILFYGVDDNNKVKWFDSTSFFDGYGNNQMHALLRMESVGKDLNLELIKHGVDIIGSNFVRNPMESNEHMLLSYDAPWWVITLSILLSSLVSGGLSWLFGNYEFTSKGFHRNNSYSPRRRSSSVYIKTRGGMRSHHWSDDD